MAHALPVYQRNPTGNCGVWAVVRTHPNACSRDYEPDAHLHDLPVVLRSLARQGFEYYNPRFLRNQRRVQLFANYLFVRIVNQWHALRSTFGVSELLMAPGYEQPAIVPDTLIERLKKCEDKNGVVMEEAKFYIGQKLQIRSGPFAEMCGEFDGHKDHERVYVLLRMLGSTRRIPIDERSVRVASI